MRVIAADPGLAHFGWAVLEVRDTETHVLRAGVIRTKRESKKRQTFEMSDRRRRLDEIRTHLDELIRSFPPTLAAMEEISPPRSSASAMSLAMAATAFGGLCWSAEVPLVPVLPQDVRRTLGITASASKDELRGKVVELLPIAMLERLRIEGAENAASQHHHAIDAIAIGLAALKTTAAKLLGRGHVSSSRSHHNDRTPGTGTA